ncbi:MAG TPA: glycosyltransferase family 4 protein [Thermoanaerobaculia bacterium]|nr:glycosyltransferase family 4 protein [Thermoanaerobaculia bacterium]
MHQMFQAAAGLSERGHDVTVVSRPGGSLAGRLAEAGLRFESLPFRNEIDLATISRLRRLVRERQPDVIHVHKGLSHTLALAATWNAPVSAFVVNRGVSFPLRLWNRAKYRTSRVDSIITVCEDIRQVIIHSGNVPPEKVSVVYAGVDLERFNPAAVSGADFRQEKGIPGDVVLLLQVGVRDWKGWRELVDAFADVHRQEPMTHLALVACKSAEQKAEVEARAVSKGVGEAVTAIEYRSDMPRVLAAADIVVDASWAGTGITGTIREAMAMNRAVIATDCGGNRELVIPSVGWLIPPKNHEALVAAMLEALRDPEARRDSGRRGRERVEQGFSKEQRIDRLGEIYREIVARKTARSSDAERP